MIIMIEEKRTLFPSSYICIYVYMHQIEFIYDRKHYIIELF